MLDLNNWQSRSKYVSGDCPLSTNVDLTSTRRAIFHERHGVTNWNIHYPSRAGRFVRFWVSGGAKSTKMIDSLPWTPMNRRAKLDAASFILSGEIRNRTNKQKHTQTVTDIYIPCLSARVDNKAVATRQLPQSKILATSLMRVNQWWRRGEKKRNKPDHDRQMLHSPLPARTEYSYNLRRRRHDYELIAKTRTLNINSFIIRMLYRNSY